MLGLGLATSKNNVPINIIKNGLILYLDGKDFLNGPPTAIWKDKSGHGNNATVNNFGYTTNSGSDGQDKVKFDGIDDACVLATPLNLTTQGTIIVNLKTSVVGTQGIIGNNDFNSDLNGYQLYISNDNHLKFEMCNATSSQAISTYTSASDGNSHFCAVTWDSTNANIYLDGIKRQYAQTIIPTNGAYNCLIGNGNAFTSYFNGTIKNILAYNRALSDAEILKNYKILK